MTATIAKHHSNLTQHRHHPRSSLVGTARWRRWLVLLAVVWMSSTAAWAAPHRVLDDDFTGTGTGVPPGWTVKSGSHVDDSDPTKVSLSRDTEILSSTQFDPSKGGSIEWKVDSSGQTGGREIQYSVYLYGEGGSVLQFWFNVNHAGSTSTLRLDEGWRPASVSFSSQVPIPAAGHEGTLTWTPTTVRLQTSFGIDVSHPWSALVGSTASKLADFGQRASVAIRGRPGTAQRFDRVSVMAGTLAGPQSPRDINSKAGTNTTVFSLAPPSTQMNLCNIHFHKYAEHKGSGYTLEAASGGHDGGHGNHGGYQCKAPHGAGHGTQVCNNVQVGDTIEVHWVYTSCNVKPGKSLGACSFDGCLNPQLRVEAAVFLLVDDASAPKMADFDYHAVPLSSSHKYHQPKSLPAATAGAVQYLGSTTGPSYNSSPSPYQVTWNVRQQCAMLNLASLGAWCGNNVFDEDHAHGVRNLVTDKEMLSQIP